MKLNILLEWPNMHAVDPRVRGAVIPNLLSWETDTLEPHLQWRGSLEGQRWSWIQQGGHNLLQDAPENHVKVLQQIMILPGQRKLANLADVPLALSLPSEEQYSKCLTSPSPTLPVNGQHFRDLFSSQNYLATVDSFVTQSLNLIFWHNVMCLLLTHTRTHVHWLVLLVRIMEYMNI